MYIGVDSCTRLAHSAVVTAANVHGMHLLPELVRGNQQRVYSDSAYPSQVGLIRLKELRGLPPVSRTHPMT